MRTEARGRILATGQDATELDKARRYATGRCATVVALGNGGRERGEERVERVEERLALD
jgi:hypothetical protein